MKIQLMMLYVTLALSINVQAESLYKWVDKNGKVHYGDQPAEDAIKPIQKKFSSTSAVSDDDLPYSVRKAKADFPVTFYVAPNCGELCIQARTMLNKRGIPFTEKNLETAEDIAAFKAKTGGNSTPSLTVGKTLLSGYEAGQWNNELDIAGYPKSAPYGIRPVQPEAPKPVVPAEDSK